MKYILLLLMTICGACGGAFLKMATHKITCVRDALKCKELYIGGILYCTGAILNILLLRMIPYSIVMPLNAMTYIWAFILGVIVFKEKMNRYKISGVIIIIVGVIILSIA